MGKVEVRQPSSAALTEKVIKAILIKLGDYFIAKSDNKLDDTLWAEVKKALG